MVLDTTTPATPRRWQDVARERGISLRVLGEMVGRPHSTMLAYSCGKRTMPIDLVERLGNMLGERVR